MKANEFVKKFGWDKVKSIVINFNYNSSNKFVVNLNNNSAISIYDLKRLVKSHELVALFDDIDCAKAWVSDLDSDWPYQVKGADTKFFKWQLEQAILDVESCM